MASAATSAGPTTRRMGSVARSSARRLSRSSPRIDAERGVSTKPAAIRLTRIGASLEREVGDEGGERDGGCRGDSEASPWAACAGAAHEYQGAGRPDLVGSGTCDLDREQKVISEIASCGLCRHCESWPVVGGARGNHYVVDRAGKILEERLQGGRIIGVKSCGAFRVQLQRCLLEARGISAREDDAGALGTGAPRGFQPNSRGAANDDDGLAEQFRLALSAYHGSLSWRFSSVISVFEQALPKAAIDKTPGPA